MGVYRYLVVLPILFTILNILPLFVDVNIDPEIRSYKLHHALTSEGFKNVFMFSLALTVPMLVDVVTYFIHKDSYFLLERTILLLACDVPLVLLFAHRETSRPDLLFAAVTDIQTLWVYWILFRGAEKSTTQIWRRPYTIASFVGFNISQMVPYFQCQQPYGHNMYYAFNLFFTFAWILLSAAYIMYLRELWLRNEEHSCREYLPLFCSTMLILFTGASVFPFNYWKVGTNYQYMNLDCLCFLILMDSFVTVVVTLLPGRIARLEVHEVEKYLETKKSFIRYIGHELRTPLNVASIGLDLIAAASFPQLESLTQQSTLDDCSPGKPDTSMKQIWSVLEENENADVDDLSKSKSKSKSGASELRSLSRSMYARISAQANSHKYQQAVLARDIDTVDNIEDLENQARSRATSIASKNEGCPTMLDQELCSVLVEVRKAVLFGTDILDSLLSYDKLDTKNMMLEKTFIDVSKLVSNSLSLFKMQADVKKVTFSMEVESNLPLLHGDEFKIRQVLCNMASNAVKFTLAEGRIDVAVKRHEGNLMIQFRDDGVGIAKENLPKVFKKIIQFDANANQKGKGTGLGLYITRGLVELHGGSVSVESDGLGSGCTFCVMLPFTGERRRHTAFVPRMATYLRMLFYRVLRSIRGDYVHMSSVSDSSVSIQNRRNEVVAVPLAPQEDVEANIDSDGGPLRKIATLSKQPSDNTVLCSGHASADSGVNLINCSTHPGGAACGLTRSSSRGRVGSISDAVESTSRLVVASPQPVPWGPSSAECSKDNLTGRMPSLQLTTHEKIENCGVISSDHSVKYGALSLDALDRGCLLIAPSRFAVDHSAGDNSLSNEFVGRIASTGSSDLENSTVTPLLKKKGSHSGAPITPTQWMAGLTALLVDDSASSIKMLSMLLKKLGCKCLVAYDGTEAVEIVQNLDSSDIIDFVLMDNYMTVMSGPEASKRMRAMGYKSPIIGLTGHALTDDIAIFKAAGADEVLAKPLDLHHLQTLLRQRLPQLGSLTGR
jgi:signal transduction histidine kinase/CheY-like chemotaxis protein